MYCFLRENKGNMNTNLIKKELTVVIIMLFISATISPAIHAETEEETELIEVTTEICGLNRKPHTAKLTKLESEELNVFLDSVGKRFSQVKTREETLVIFKEVIEELDKYGLLGDTSIEQVERLIFSRYFRAEDFNTSYKKQHLNNNLNDYKNTDCLIAGSSSVTYFSNPIAELLWSLFWQLDAGFLKNLVLILSVITGFLTLIPAQLNPFPIAHWIYYGAYIDGHRPRPSKAEGWIFTIGKNGIQSFDGSFVGSLSSGALSDFCGAQWFTGIKILNGWFYLGFAKKVQISDW